ncbi:MAG: ATP-grasp domain-containing protein [Deltaproteobacteria bacterium]|nr:ATP-grasp domain-containing protein [Deltaproteobacteria bacterium]
MRRVGILGGGQLGSMLAEALYHLDAQVTLYDADPNAPAALRYRDTVVAPWNDAAAIARFFERCDVVTYEFEHIDAAPLRALQGGPPIAPSVRVLEITQDRAMEKQFLAESGLPHVHFAVVRSEAELRAAAGAFGWPFILKTIRGGYDGKGQFYVAGHEDLDAAILALRERRSDFACVLEEIVDLALEASCIVARSGEQELVFPLFENAHSGHILDLTVVPARVPPEVARVVQEVALRTARAIELEGLLTVEFFVGRTRARRSHGAEAGGLIVYVNELAPRPHNSGHVTRNACTISQYDALARVLAGVPLTPPRMNGPGAWCMANLLGDVWLAQGRDQLDLSCWRDHPLVVDVVLYGKREARARRKMGHFVTHADTADAAIDAARAFREALSRRTM